MGALRLLPVSQCCTPQLCGLSELMPTEMGKPPRRVTYMPRLLSLSLHLGRTSSDDFVTKACPLDEVRAHLVPSVSKYFFDLWL